MPLQRSFRGLSNHLGSFLGGNLSFEANPELVMQSNVEDFVNPYEWLRSVASLTAIGQAAIQTVPQGEFWRVRSLHYELINNTGAASGVFPVVNPDQITLVGLSQIAQGGVALGTRQWGGRILQSRTDGNPCWIPNRLGVQLDCWRHD